MQALVGGGRGKRRVRGRRRRRRRKRGGAGEGKGGGGGEGLRDETPYIVVGYLNFITLIIVHTFESIFDFT